MKPRPRAAMAALAAACAIAAWAQSSQTLDLDGSADLGKKQWIEFLGPEGQTVAAAKTAVVPLRFRVANGLHVNSHKPKSDYLIPTQLAFLEGPGVRAERVDFPPGSEYAFSFDPKNKLDVYTGEFKLDAHITAQRGEHLVHAVLRYQACDHAACYPPRTLPIEVKLTAK